MAEEKSLLKAAIEAHESGTLSEADRQDLIGKLRKQADNPGIGAGARSDFLHAADALASGTREHVVARRQVRANLAKAQAEVRSNLAKAEAKPKSERAPKRAGLLSRLTRAQPKPIAPKLEQVVNEIGNAPALSPDECRKILKRAGVLEAAGCAGAPYTQLRQRVGDAILRVTHPLRREADLFEVQAGRVLALLQEAQTKWVETEHSSETIQRKRQEKLARQREVALRLERKRRTDQEAGLIEESGHYRLGARPREEVERLAQARRDKQAVEYERIKTARQGGAS